MIDFSLAIIKLTFFKYFLPTFSLESPGNQFFSESSGRHQPLLLVRVVSNPFFEIDSFVGHEIGAESADCVTGPWIGTLDSQVILDTAPSRVPDDV